MKSIKPVTATVEPVEPVFLGGSKPHWFDAPLHLSWWSFTGRQSAYAEKRVFRLFQELVEYRDEDIILDPDTVLRVFWLTAGETTAEAAMIIGKSVSGEIFAVRYEQGWRMAVFSGGEMKLDLRFPSRDRDKVMYAVLNV